MKTERSKSFILWFDEIGIEDIPLVGGKNASLGEMLQDKKSKVKIPPGFAITSYAYRYILEKSGVLDELKAVLHGLNIKNSKAWKWQEKRRERSSWDASCPSELQEAIAQAYHKLSSQCKVRRIWMSLSAPLRLRKICLRPVLPGQQESFLNICGVKPALKACKSCFASLFTNRAIVYRAENKFDHFKVYLSIGVQKMVRSDLASAGVIFTLDTESGFRDVVFITGSYGLGESVVQGAVNPDEFYVFKPTLKQGYKPLIDKRLGRERRQKLSTHKRALIQSRRSKLHLRIEKNSA